MKKTHALAQGASSTEPRPNGEKTHAHAMRQHPTSGIRTLVAFALAGALAAGTIAGCAGAPAATADSDAGSAQVASSVASGTVGSSDAASGVSDVVADATIVLEGDGATATGEGVTVDGSEVTIASAGSYEVTGTLDDGQLVEDATGEVVIYLDGADIHNDADDAIHVKSGSVTIVLVEGSVNRLSSADESFQAATEEEASGAALFSKGELTITGEGELVVSGYVNNGINGKGGVTIESGTISVVSANDAIKSSEGSIVISGGSVDVLAGDEGISAYTTLDVTGGTVVVEASDKGVKAEGDLTIDGEQTVVSVTSGDEGIESKSALTINEGSVTVVAADDGINAGGSGSGEHAITINGGAVVVDAQGDGLDSNGDLVINGGDVIVYGPTNDGNSALDVASEYGGTCTVTGGTVIAMGSSGMAEGFGQASTQCSIMYGLDGYAEAGSTIQVLDQGGNVIFECESSKQFSNVVFSSAGLVQGETYTLVVGANSYEVTLDGVSTSAGSVGMGMGGMPDGGMGGMPDGGMGGMPGGDMGAAPTGAPGGSQGPAGN